MVDGSYTGPEAGTEAQPFRTISAALARAVDGDLIKVAPGLYRENITLKPGVGVVARPIGAAIIHGGARPSSGRPTVVGANDALLEGFVVTGGYSGIRCDRTSPTISRNVVRGNYGTAGIVCLNGSQAAVVNNTVLGNFGKPSIGIYVEACVPRLRNNIIAFNGFGLSPYRTAPDSDYNNIWGNRQNFGYNARPNVHDQSVDPGFRSTEWDDYRLAAGSRCAGAGDPDPQYQATASPTVDLGAFQGDAGYTVGPAAQEYFVESVLGALPQAGGTLKLNGTSRFTSNPTFWFDATSRGTPGEADTRRILAQAVPDLTDGRYAATFRDDPSPPPNPCGVVTVRFVGPPHPSDAYREGSTADCGDPDGQLRSRGAAIVGGYMDTAPESNAGQHWSATQVGDRLARVAGLDRSFRGRGIRAVGAPYVPGATIFGALEREVFKLLYQYPPGTTLATLIRDKKLLPNALQPFPHIDVIQKFSSLQTTTEAKAGEAIVLVGSRLTMRMTSERYVVVPGASVAPEVYFGDVVVVPDLNDYAVPDAPARALKVYVPASARSGWVFVKAHGLESNPVWLEIT